MLVKPERQWLLFDSHVNRFYIVQKNPQGTHRSYVDIHYVLSPSPISKLSNRCGEDLTATTNILHSITRTQTQQGVIPYPNEPDITPAEHKRTSSSRSGSVHLPVYDEGSPLSMSYR